jgi:hypothetical protein
MRAGQAGELRRVHHLGKFARAIGGAY